MPRAATSPAILASLSTIEVARPSELVLQQLRHLLSSGALRPGDRLPAERDLARQFGVGRSHVRDALRRLEFYGILQTQPQSGTIVARLGVAALNNLIGNVLALDRDDVAALLETRVVLEVETARLAAIRASPAQRRSIAQAQDNFRSKALAGDPALAEDLTLHLAIADAAHNAVLASLVGLIAPDIMRHHGQQKTCDSARLVKVVGEHQAICDAIESRDPPGAAIAMANHARMARDQYRRTPSAGVVPVAARRRKGVAAVPRDRRTGHVA
jgi:GntR family transcriptional regulator, transcriptional repressor for pyruvate dehydrogenase complex